MMLTLNRLVEIPSARPSTHKLHIYFQMLTINYQDYCELASANPAFAKMRKWSTTKNPRYLVAKSRAHFHKGNTGFPFKVFVRRKCALKVFINIFKGMQDITPHPFWVR